MDKEINSNGFGFVDLDLPSGTLWATSNVGASKPSDIGLYFQWGDVQGCTAEQVGEGEGKKAFTWNDYKWKGNNTKINIKITTTDKALELEDDAAHVHMGGDWHMPSPDQFQELINNTTSEWITMDGVNGRRFTSKNGNSIFFPAAGYAQDGSIRNSRDGGVVWSSVLSAGDVHCGQFLSFGSDYASLYGYSYRCYGFSVRGVIDKNDKNMNLSELIKNEIKNNFKVKVSTDYGGYVNVELLYDGEVISSDVCQVITDFNSLDE